MPQAAETKLNSEQMQGEFVVGGSRGFYASEVLHNTNGADYLQPNFTVEVQRRMRYDAEIESSVEFLIDAVFADGVAPVSVVTDEDDADFALATEIADFCRAATDNPHRTLEAVLREQFRGAFYSGVKLGEIILAPNENSDLVLDRINLKPNDSVGFVCDKFFNVLGIIGATDSGAFPSALSLNPGDILRREKFTILQFELEDNDPRGIAKIRAALDGWTDKKDTRAQYKEWRRTSAIPKKFGTTAPTAREVPLRNPDGTQAFSKDGVPLTISAEKALMIALEGFANNSTVVGPHETKVEQLEVNGTGQQFTNAIKLNNSEIRKAILGDSLATGEADKDARAAKEVAMGVVELRIRSFRNKIAEMVKRDIYRLLTIVNFGRDKAFLTPNCSTGDTDRRSWEATANALVNAGWYMAPEHLREGDAMLNFKPREKDAETIEPEKQEEKDNENPGDEQES